MKPIIEPISTIENIRDYFKGIVLEVSGSILTLPSPVDSNCMAIDLWNNAEDIVNCALDQANINGPPLEIEVLYIKAHNHLKINLGQKPEELFIKRLIIESPGLVLDTKLVFNELNVFVTGSKVSLPDFVAETVTIEKINYPIEQRLRYELKGFVMIPGCREFVLDPWFSMGKKAPKSLQELRKDFPFAEWVSPVVAWFGTSLDIKECKIKPGYDQNYPEALLNMWQVGGFDRNNAYPLSLNNFGNTNYGGSINDVSVRQYLKLLKAVGLKIAFYPLLMLDVEGKIWRGRLSGDAESVELFYSNEYEPFILHYAKLTKPFANAFIIGSELVALTKIHDSNYIFPFIEKLIELAGKVREILGPDVKVTYAADWSEYYSSDGVQRPLDKLWACKDIDMVGIDAYFPLTDLNQVRITEEQIRKGWESGEGWDYYYEDKTKTFYKEGEYWNCWKNLEYWWNSEHWVGNCKTPWAPQMKPIWFTEFGFPSVDKASNQPNVFYDMSSKESAFPKHSQGKIDYAIQKNAILATLDFCKDSKFIEQIFYWCWDARGSGWAFNDCYADGRNWAKGHWIDGKMENRQPIYVGPTQQLNLSIKSYTDIDLIPNLRVTHNLKVETTKSIKIRDDMVVPNHNYFDYQDMTISDSHKKRQFIDLFREHSLEKFNNESKILAGNCRFIFEEKYIVVTSYGITNGTENDINDQLYTKDTIDLLGELF